MFIKFLSEVAPLIFKNALKIMLGSKSEKFKNIEARQKVVYSYKKSEVRSISRQWERSDFPLPLFNLSIHAAIRRGRISAFDFNS